jgi:hypothetical protein
MVEFSKGSLWRLKKNLGTSKVFSAGTIIVMNYDSSDSNSRLHSDSFKTYLDDKPYRGYDHLYKTNLEPVSKEEIEEMNKPSEFIIHTIGTNLFQKTSDANKDKNITTILTNNPAAEVAVYRLEGVAKTKPVEVQFTMAASLD